MACLKLQVPKMVTKSKKVKFQKLMQLVPVLTCFQYIMNPNIFIIRDIFRTLNYSKARGYLDPCQKYCKAFWKKFRAMTIFAGRNFTDHFRCLAEFQMRLWIYKCYLVCTVILGSVSSVFRYTRALFKSIV